MAIGTSPGDSRDDDDFIDDRNDTDIEERCPHCRKWIYHDIPQCPHCGNFITDEDDEQPQHTNVPVWVWYTAAGLLVLMLLSVLRG